LQLYKKRDGSDVSNLTTQKLETQLTSGYFTRNQYYSITSTIS